MGQSTREGNQQRKEGTREGNWKSNEGTRGFIGVSRINPAKELLAEVKYQVTEYQFKVTAGSTREIQSIGL